MQVVDPIRDGFAAGSGKSWTLTRSGAPSGCHSRPPFLKAPTSSFFLVSTEMAGWRWRCAARPAARCSGTGRRGPGAGPFQGLDVALQAVAERVQQISDHAMADRMALRVRAAARSACSCRSSATATSGRRVARFYQRVEIPQERRSVGLARLRPPPARRTRSGGNGAPGAANSATPRLMVAGAGRSRARPSRCRHTPSARASVAARSRRDRSVKTPRRAACFARSVATDTPSPYHGASARTTHFTQLFTYMP